MTQEQKIALRDKALTDLFNSKQLQEKLDGICYRHGIPEHAAIQQDILQVVFENLLKYDLDKFIKAHTKDPKRILALAVTIALRKGVYKDERAAKWFNNSIGQQILFGSSLTSRYSFGFQGMDDYEDEDSYRLKEALKTDEEGYYSDEQKIEEEQTAQKKEDDFNKTWEYIRSQLTPDENKDLIAIVTTIKLKGRLKKKYNRLLPKIKTIAQQWRTQNA